MAKFCTGCGAELMEGKPFCTACGMKVEQPSGAQAPEMKAEAAPVTPPPAPVTPPARPVAPPPPPVTPPPVAVVPSGTATKTAPAKTEPAAATVKTSTYFWLMLLFALPLIGILSCIIAAFAPKNRSIRNFAKAILLWTLIGIIISGILMAAFAMLANQFVAIVEESLNIDLTDLGGALEQYGQSVTFEGTPYTNPS